MNEQPDPSLKNYKTDSIFDDLYLEGNKFSHSGRIFDYRINEKAKNSPLKIETSLDYFGGILLGHFPYFSFEVYRANVHDFKI